MKKLFTSMIAALAAGAVLLAAAGCGADSAKSGSAPAQDKKIQVVASFYPLADFAKNVGKDAVEVHNLVQPGVEPHDWEPTSKDMKIMSQADVLVYNGAGFEPWIEKILSSIDKSKVVVVDVSKGVDLLKAAELEHDHTGEHPAAQKEQQPAAKQDDHARGEYDPHFWIDPVNAQKEVQQIADGLAKKDVQNKDKYEANAKEYNAKLQALHTEFQTELAKTKKKEVVTTHAAFGYLTHRYGLQQIPLMGLAPDAEPSPKALADIVTEARGHDVKYIFFETLVSPKVAETVAKEIGAKTLVLNPIEGLSEEQLNKGEDYISTMRDNLNNLITALGN